MQAVADRLALESVEVETRYGQIREQDGFVEDLQSRERTAQEIRPDTPAPASLEKLA